MWGVIVWVLLLGQGSVSPHFCGMTLFGCCCWVRGRRVHTCAVCQLWQRLVRRLSINLDQIPSLSSPLSPPFPYREGSRCTMHGGRGSRWQPRPCGCPRQWYELPGRSGQCHHQWGDASRRLIQVIQTWCRCEISVEIWGDMGGARSAITNGASAELGSAQCGSSKHSAGEESREETWGRMSAIADGATDPAA